MILEKRQAELIAEACKQAGLDGHIKWIEGRKTASTWAEQIMYRFKGGTALPVKNSYMYCDTLDMCFAYTESGQPVLAYAGYVMAGQPDITGGKLLEAFRKAGHVLETMRELAEEEKGNVIQK